MDAKPSEMFSDEEKDILQEIMNIAFGNATADLAEVIDIYVLLSVPEIQIIEIGKLPDYLDKTISSGSAISMVEQKFWGEFKGSGLLVFPGSAGKSLISLLDESKAEELESGSIATLEKGALLEIGNILIGACVGKISELLSTFATYSPPQVLRKNADENNFTSDLYDPNQTAIVMKTIFKFEKKNIDGLLLILTNQESITWLRKALHDFMDSYE